MYRLTKHETMGYCIMEYNYGGYDVATSYNSQYYMYLETVS